MNAPQLGPRTDTDLVRVLARGLAILRAFTPNNDWKSNREIATLTALPRPTVSRLTASLTSLGYLDYSADRSAYRLGTSVLALGFAALANVDVRIAARPLMQALANDADVLVTLALRDGMEFIAAEVCHSARRVISLRLDIGSRLPLARSAFGHALLGALDPQARAQLLAQIRASLPAEWPTLEAELATAIAQYEKLGFAVSLSSLQPGVNGVALALDTPGAPYVYLLSCAAPADQADRARIIAELGPRMIALKRAIARQMTRS